MKRLFAVTCLLLTTTVTNANCPLPPSGYYFGMAGWGDHTSTQSRIRCYYYHSGWEDQNEIDTYEYYNQNNLVGPRWYNEYRYAACRSDNNDVSDCAFKANLTQKK